jgi:hypothetical protein
MADSLVLKGVKDIRNHTGSEMVYMSNPRAGDTYQIPQWDAVNAGTTINVDCTRFLVTVGANSVNLVIKQSGSEDCDLLIEHDGSFGFTFPQHNEVRGAALYTSDWELIEYYVFPVGVKEEVRTVAGTAAKPGTTPITIGTVTVTGETAPADSATEAYTVAISGNATDGTIAITSSDANDTVSGLNVTFSGAGARTLTATVTSGTATDSGATGTLDVTVS